MNSSLREQLIRIARREIKTKDMAHDIEHAMRVLHSAERIGEAENSDMEVIVPAALFHDLVVYPKNDPDSANEQELSAEKAGGLLRKIEGYPDSKIATVEHCIRNCSFSKGVNHILLEAQVLQDADGLEATGAISILRTFASTGSWERPFYSPDDPFCRDRQPDANAFALDLFFVRLLKVEERMYTKTAKSIAARRTEFLRVFLKELEIELEGK